MTAAGGFEAAVLNFGTTVAARSIIDDFVY
jgi:hypothetical protein